MSVRLLAAAPVGRYFRRAKQSQFHGLPRPSMSKYNAPKPLGSVLKDVISSLGIDSRLADARVIAVWEEIIGERIGREVEKVWVKGDRLIVRIKSPVWRQELHLNRDSWRRRLNEELGEERVREIVFR